MEGQRGWSEGAGLAAGRRHNYMGLPASAVRVCCPSCPLRISVYPTSRCPPHTRDRVNHCLGTVKDGVEDVCEGLHGGKGHVVHAANDLHKDLRMEEGWLRSVLANAYPPGHMHVLK